MDESDRTTIELQVGLAVAALASAIANTLRESVRHEDALVTLQRKAQVEQTRLRRTPNAEMAATIFRHVTEALRNSDVI
jgi:hypothetical protein